MRRFVTGPYAPASLLAAVLVAGAPTSLYERGLRRLPSLPPARPAAENSTLHGALSVPMRALAKAMSVGGSDEAALDWLTRTPTGGGNLPALAGAGAQNAEQTPVAALGPTVPPPMAKEGAAFAGVLAWPTWAIGAARAAAVASNEAAQDWLERNAAQGGDRAPVPAPPVPVDSDQTRVAALEPSAPSTPSSSPEADEDAAFSRLPTYPAAALTAAASMVASSSDAIHDWFARQAAARADDNRSIAASPSPSQAAHQTFLAALESPASMRSLSAPAPNSADATALAGFLALAPRVFGAGAADAAAAHDRAVDWLMRKTPLRGDKFPALAAAAALYQKGDVPGGDALAHQIGDPLQKLALEWVALRAAPRAAGFARLAAFLAAHPQWPSHGWIVSFQEAALYGERGRPDVVRQAFAGARPTTPAGVLALASVERTLGQSDKAGALVRATWRNDDLDGWLEAETIKDFAPFLSRADHHFRAMRLLYAEKYAAAMRAAALAGSDDALLAKSWIEAARGALSQAALDALPPAVKNDPGLLYARIKGLRRADRVLEAALLLARAPRDPALLVDGDSWWAERRMIARRLLDGGLAKEAYTLCSAEVAASIPERIDQAFHAGWIALRFLGDANSAARHFAEAAKIAETPLAISRAAYWQGRAAEQAGRNGDATTFYERAAAYPIAYYGQLAADKLHRPIIALRESGTIAKGEDREEATRVIEVLYAAKLDAFARSLAIDAASSYVDEAQLAALGAVAARFGDAPALVEIGKQATIRGFALDGSAFPTFGIPQFTPLAGSADLPLVYSVARQESEFVPAAASGAGAKGLMQLLPGTARDAAKRAGVAFDALRLNTDPAFNTQIGAAFLGQLLADEGGSAVLAFAAYNAGGGRVEQWINAFGDPRSTNVDVVDWIERIPFDETRDYVQRVMENWRVYRERFAALANESGINDRLARADEARSQDVAGGARPSE
jgi:peptidoglycan lytic transglycosylase